jgi:hypothetical protein
MPDDLRVKRVLKRYPKEDKFSDASLDLTGLGAAELLQACRCLELTSLDAPKALDDEALAYLARRMGIEFDSSQFDHFLHSYVRAEFFPSYYEDPSVTSKPPPESGPPPKIPLPKGMRWVSVRPKDGQEHYEAYEIDDSKNEV